MRLFVRRVLLGGLVTSLAALNACSEKKAEEPVAAPVPAEEIPAAPAAPVAPEAPEAPVAPEAAPAKAKAKSAKKKSSKKPAKK